MQKNKRVIRRLLAILTASAVLAIFGTTAQAQDVPMATQAGLDTTWVLLTGFLVFFMQTGFAMLETGLVRSTSAVNALLENFIDAGVTAIAFWAVGFGIAFGVSAGGFIGTSNFFLSQAMTVTADGAAFAKIGEVNPFFSWATLDVYTFFFFQFAFAATASTITTGAMAERTDFVGDLIYSTIMGAFSYPIIVHWIWGGGWLQYLGVVDFAGSTVVHTVGGVTALVGAILLGARACRTDKDGKWLPLPPAHNLGLATIGTMILWFGWFGFNPGSTLGMGNTGLVGLIVVNTTLGAAGGGILSLFVQYFRSKKWDLVYTMNGSLAGLVAVTAGCAFVEPWAALVIGAVAGVLVIYAADFVEAGRVDDPVGAFAVHGACGIWGTIAIGLFARPELLAAAGALTTNAAGEALARTGLVYGGGVTFLLVQALGSGVTVAFTAAFGFLMFGALKAMGRLRVSKVVDDVNVYIDDLEHGQSVYPEVRPAVEVSEGGKVKTTKAPAAGD
jgi:ammonium transporter, Amt family